MGDPELTARVIGGFDAPGTWTRSDDPAAAVVAAAERALTFPSGQLSIRTRARLLGTIAMETRGTANKLAEAREAEKLARLTGDPHLLCFALNARFMQTFWRTGLASQRSQLGQELITAAQAAESATFEISGHLIRMQLSRTDEVEIYNHGRVMTSGRIDMLSLDGSVLWLQQDEGKGRALFLHSDGLRVYRRPVKRS